MADLIELTNFSNSDWARPLVRGIPMQRRRRPVGGAIYKTRPVNNTPPHVSGIPTVGQTLTSDTGGWSQVALAYHGPPILNQDGSVQIDSQTGQIIYAAIFQWIWRRNGVVLPLSQGPTYLLTTADLGAIISVELWGANPVGSTLVFSNNVGPITAALSISGTPVTTGNVGVVYGGFTITASGGHAPYTYNITSGSLPPGIFLDGHSGVVTGRPTATGANTATVTASDLYGLTISLAPFTITIS